jgi:rSAM/selenodomain-associated transferase 1
MNENALVIMAKEPKVGSTKTRMTPSLTLEEAARLYEVLLWDTIALVAGIKNVDLAITVTPPESEAYFKRVAPTDTILIPVECENLGQCLSSSLSCLLEMKYKKVFALNGDGPSLPADFIQQAIQKLEDHDLVLGPTYDGGYYLVGFKELLPEIFEDISWSTDRVLAQSLQQARQQGRSIHQLPIWYDVDDVDDLEKLQAEMQNLPPDSLKHTRKYLEQWSQTK